MDHPWETRFGNTSRLFHFSFENLAPADVERRAHVPATPDRSRNSKTMVHSCTIQLEEPRSVLRTTRGSSHGLCSPFASTTIRLSLCLAAYFRGHEVSSDHGGLLWCLCRTCGWCFFLLYAGPTSRCERVRSREGAGGIPCCQLKEMQKTEWFSSASHHSNPFSNASHHAHSLRILRRLEMDECIPAASNSNSSHHCKETPSAPS